MIIMKKNLNKLFSFGIGILKKSNNTFDLEDNLFMEIDFIACMGIINKAIVFSL